jgi:hypothetical protein
MTPSCVTELIANAFLMVIAHLGLHSSLTFADPHPEPDTAGRLLTLLGSLSAQGPPLGSL